MPISQDKEHLVYKKPTLFWVWFIVAQLSFLTTLFLPYQGEEAVYTLTSIEMAFNKSFFVSTLYSENYARPPLFNWFIVPIADLIGWRHVLVASRLVTILATLSTSVVLIALVNKLYKNITFSIFVALIFMSGDVLFRRGWLAYADPLFSFYVFSAIACLWVYIIEKRPLLLLLAAISLIASFLTKALTGYVFYGIAFIVLFYRTKDKNILLKPYSISLHIIILLFPILWNHYLSHGADGGAMVHDIITKFNLENLKQYLGKVLFYPVDTFTRWLPISGLVAYFGVQKYYHKKTFFQDPSLKDHHFVTVSWIFIVNYLPYWFAPETHVRYLLPLYPFIALILGYVIWNMGQQKVKSAFYGLAICILLRFAVGLWVFPYYEKHYRGDYRAVAGDILKLTEGQATFTTTHLAVGLSVVAELDVLRLPKPPLKQPRLPFKHGFVISTTPHFPDTKIFKEYRLGRHALFLLCRGNACKGEPPIINR